jgi:hypothetical protein
VLCFTDHTLNGNLCLTNIENYVLGSNFSWHNHQKSWVRIFIRKDIHFSSLDLSNYCDKKPYEICAVQLGSTGKQWIVVFIKHHQGSIINF